MAIYHGYLGFKIYSCACNYYCYHYLFSYERFASDSPPYHFTEDSAWLSDLAAECLLSSSFSSLFSYSIVHQTDEKWICDLSRFYLI